MISKSFAIVSKIKKKTANSKFLIIDFFMFLWIKKNVFSAQFQINGDYLRLSDILTEYEQNFLKKISNRLVGTMKNFQLPKCNGSYRLI